MLRINQFHLNDGWLFAFVECSANKDRLLLRLKLCCGAVWELAAEPNPTTNRPGKRLLTIGLANSSANDMQHRPRGFISDLNPLLKLFSINTAACSRDKKDSNQPL